MIYKLDKKYILTDETKMQAGKRLYRIKAIKDFLDVRVDNLGGWIEKEENLSHEGNCWVYGDAMVYENAHVYDDAALMMLRFQVMLRLAERLKL